MFISLYLSTLLYYVMALPHSISKLSVFPCFGSGVPWTLPELLSDSVHLNSRKKPSSGTVSKYGLILTTN